MIRLAHPALLLHATVEVLYPPVCPACAAETGAAASLCPDCWRETGFLGTGGCRHCARPLPGPAARDEAAICDECLRHAPRWRRGAAAVRYAGIGRRLVLALKHGDRLDLVPMLAGWLLRAGGALVSGADLVAPVPLHWTRRMRRRANQSAELARAVCRIGGWRGSYAPGLLRRVRRTASQDGLGRAARAENLAGAFEAGAGMTDKRVLLVDDVLTTGATLNAVAEICYAAGAASVDVLVIALVMRREHAYLGAGAEEDGDEAS